MPVARSEWEGLSRRSVELETLEHRANVALARMRQAALPMERLTGSEHWDTYLRMLEARQADERAQLADVKERLSGADFRAPDEVARLRHAAAILSVSIAVRQDCMELPVSILQKASEANAGK